MVTGQYRELPAGSICYRRLGPFDEQSIPRGLLAEHRLKPEVWVILTVEAGAIVFAWDDPALDRVRLGAGDPQIVPPCVPHHLEVIGPVRLSLEFHR